MVDLLALLVPCPDLVRLDSVSLDEVAGQIVVSLTSVSVSVACPVCGTSTQRVHSGYTRWVADLPWVERQVCLQLHVRKFLCLQEECPRRIFTERLPAIVRPWGRRSVRLGERQRWIGLALGGSAGARLSRRLGQPASRNTLLRLIRATPLPALPTPRVLGVDDFALRKGNTYGTILVDLERRQPIALLPGREAAVLRDWLRAHPGVEIIARDRAGAYAQGAATGAPAALQVADRFHLLRNLVEVLIQVFEPQPAALRWVTQGDAALPPPLQDPALPALPAPLPPDVPALPVTEQADELPLSPRLVAPPPSQACPQRQAYRHARHGQVIALHQQGWTYSAIARQVGLNRKTVRQYVTAGQCVERRRPGSRLDPFKPYLLARWNGGCRTGVQLFQEICQQGYRGGRSVVLAYLTRLRQTQGLPPRSRALTAATGEDADAERPLSPRRAAWQVVQRPDRQEEDDRQCLERLRQAHPDFDAGITLAQGFVQMLRARQPERLDEWLEKAAASTLGAFRRFAASLRRDYAAVKAGLTVAWSTGPVEGQINRLKMLKRQTFGRAGLDLLEQRVIQAD